jgi:hypothetical protein
MITCLSVGFRLTSDISFAFVFVLGKLLSVLSTMILYYFYLAIKNVDNSPYLRDAEIKRDNTHKALNTYPAYKKYMIDAR